MKTLLARIVTPILLLIATTSHASVTLVGTEGTQLNGEIFGEFESPWAMVFISDTEALITQKTGELLIYDTQLKQKTVVGDLPDVTVGGQGGLGDVILHPQFSTNNTIYISYVESGMVPIFRGAAVMRATLSREGDTARLKDKTVIWRQIPKVKGRGHFGHRMAFSKDGYLFITSGERQHFTPAQDMAQNLGKMIRLNADGSVPDDNPYADQKGVTREIWSSGHRNPLGLIFDATGRLWEHEMGPRGGDELNLIIKGENYGYPHVSEGDHYSGAKIPRHSTAPQFKAPEISWNPSLSPAGFTLYQGERFPHWNNTAFMGGLSSQSITQVHFDGDNATIAERFDHAVRVREVESGPDGYLWMLEDGPRGRLVRLELAR